MPPAVEESNQLESTTVWINRTSTTVKGGRRLSFAALVVVGDRNGSVGLGYGKGRGVPNAIEKAQKIARRDIFKLTMNGGTLPHAVTGRFLSSKVRLLPAAPGTGVIAGGTVRAVLEMAGVHDCLTKCYGSTAKANLAKAVLAGLKGLRSREEVAKLRGVTIESTTVDEVLEASRIQKLRDAAAQPAPAKTEEKAEPADGDAAAATSEQAPAEPATAVAEPAAEATAAEPVADTPTEPAAEAPAEPVAESSVATEPEAPAADDETKSDTETKTEG